MFFSFLKIYSFSNDSTSSSSDSEEEIVKKKKPKREQNRKSPNIAHWLRGKQAGDYLEKKHHIISS